MPKIDYIAEFNNGTYALNGWTKHGSTIRLQLIHVKTGTLCYTEFKTGNFKEISYNANICTEQGSDFGVCAVKLTAVTVTAPKQALTNSLTDDFQSLGPAKKSSAARQIKGIPIYRYQLLPQDIKSK